MDRDLHKQRVPQSGSSLLGQGLEPFGIAETPLVDMLFSITRPDTPMRKGLAPQPTSATRKSATPVYLTAPTAPTMPKGMARQTVLRMQQPLHRARGG
jgi:hypothetical protein